MDMREHTQQLHSTNESGTLRERERECAKQNTKAKLGITTWLMALQTSSCVSKCVQTCWAMRTLAVAFLAGAAFLLDEALDFVFAVPFLSAAAFVVAAAFLLEEGVVPFFVVDLAFVDRANVFLPWLVDGFFAVTRFVVEDLVFF